MEINRDKLRERAKVSFDCEPEHVPVAGIARAGNQWAWCVVRCTASFAGREGIDYLGQCSYRNEADFVKNSGYADDMRDAALEQLEMQLQDDLVELRQVID